MRRACGLWSTIASFENLRLAAANARRGKRCRPSTALFDRDLEGELLRLREELVSKSYRPGPYREFWITDPKPRKISAAP